MSNRLVALVVAFVLSSQSGCVLLNAFIGKSRTPGLDVSMLEAQGYSIPPGGMPLPVKAEADGKPRVVLELRGDGRHLESIPLPTEKAMFVEDLVLQAKLHEQIGALSLTIMRPNGAGAPPLRLDSKTDDKGKAINIGQNYALLPGDHVIVYSDERSLLEKFIDTQLK